MMINIFHESLISFSRRSSIIFFIKKKEFFLIKKILFKRNNRIKFNYFRSKRRAINLIYLINKFIAKNPNSIYEPEFMYLL